MRDRQRAVALVLIPSAGALFAGAVAWAAATDPAPGGDVGTSTDLVAPVTPSAAATEPAATDLADLASRVAEARARVAELQARLDARAPGSGAGGTAGVSSSSGSASSGSSGPSASSGSSRSAGPSSSGQAPPVHAVTRASG